MEWGREDSNLDRRIKSPVLCPLSYNPDGAGEIRTRVSRPEKPVGSPLPHSAGSLSLPGNSAFLDREDHGVGVLRPEAAEGAHQPSTPTP